MIVPTTKRRFIAGAVCPRCAAMDTTVLYRQGDEQVRECVSCDFRDTAPLGGYQQHVGRELPTRVNEPHQQPRHGTSQDVSPIKIIEPKNYKK